MPRKAKRRPAMVALGRVVEYDVENDLDAGSVQCLDHIAEFVDRPEQVAARAVRLMRRKERNRRVSPVIDLAWGTVQRIELKHRQQLDGRDAELLEIRDLLDQARIRAA